MAAAVVTAVLGSVACRHPAAAQEAARKAAHASSVPAPVRLLIFGGSDLWRHGAFAHGGGMWLRNGDDRDGPVFKAVLSGGAYRYRSGALGNVQVTGRQSTFQALPGWRLRRGQLFVTVFAGFELQSHRLAPDDPSAGLRGGHVGLRTGLDYWHEVSPRSVLIGDTSLSTIGRSYSARAAYGRRISDRYYLGPEIAAFAAGGNYRQIRAGLHVTGMRTNLFEWSGAAGYASDTDRRSGLYGRLGVLMRK